MDTKSLKDILQNITPISANEWSYFEQYFSFRRLQKNEMLWKEGETCNHLVFVINGLIYCFQNKEGREVVSNIFSENTLFYDDYSFIKQEPCISTYVA